jgi:hypothetical protein
MNQYAVGSVNSDWWQVDGLTDERAGQISPSARKIVGRWVSFLCCLAGGLAVAGSYLPWIEYDRGGGNGTFRLSGVQGGEIGALTIVTGTGLALLGLVAMITADRQRGLLTAIPAGLGLLATLAVSLWPVDVGGIGTLYASAVGLRVEAAAFGTALILSVVIAWIDSRARSRRSAEPATSSLPG